MPVYSPEYNLRLRDTQDLRPLFKVCTLHRFNLNLLTNHLNHIRTSVSSTEK